MKRFILLTFGFLGWAFYEMSGGADFEPASARLAASAPAAIDPAAQTQAPETTVATNPTPQPVAPQQEVAELAPVDTTPPGFGEDAKTDADAPASSALNAINDAVEAAIAPLENEVVLVPVNAGSSISNQDTPAIMPSLITPNDTGTAANTSATQADIRSVSGNRVNVRGGPGTDYGIVSRLVRGDTVEVISDNGDGWVQMRPVDGGPVGWMADFLLSNS